MTEIILPIQILLCVLVVAFIVLIIVMIAISLSNKSLLCAKFYCFFFEHDDWLLYERAKKQGIKHYLNGHHFSQFCEAWDKVKDEYGVVNNNFLKLDEETKYTLCTKFDELKEKYYYKEYNETDKSINDDDIVLSLNMCSERLYIYSEGSEGIISLEPMVEDVIKSQLKLDRIFYALLANPKMVVSGSIVYRF